MKLSIDLSNSVNGPKSRVARLDYSSTEFNPTLDKLIRTRLLRRAQQAIIEETALMVDQNNSPVVKVHQVAGDLLEKVGKLIPSYSGAVNID